MLRGHSILPRLCQRGSTFTPRGGLAAGVATRSAMAMPNFSTVDGDVDATSMSYLSNAAQLNAQIERVRSLTALVVQGGGAKAAAVHRSRNKVSVMRACRHMSGL